MFNVLDSAGHIITAPEIEQQLRHIYTTCAGKPEGYGIGALTAEYRTTWWKVCFGGQASVYTLLAHSSHNALLEYSVCSTCLLF